MFCPNCGASLKDGAKFCTSCGQPVIVSAPEQPVPPPPQPPQPPQQPQQTWQPQPQQPEQQWQPQQPQPQWQQPQQPQPQWQQPQQQWQQPQQPDWGAQQAWNAPQQPVPPVKTVNKGKRLAAILIPVGAVALIAVLVAVFFQPISNFFRRTVSSPESYYQYVEKREVSRLSEDAGDYYDSFVPAQEKLAGRSLDAELSLAVGDGLRDLLSESADMDLDWFKSASLHISGALDEKLAGANVELSVNGKQIVSADGMLDLDDAALLARIPLLSDEYFRAPLEELTDALPVDMDELMGSEQLGEYQELLDALPQDEEIRQIIDRYADIVTKQIENVEKDEQTVQVLGVSQKCTRLTANIDQKTMQKIVTEVGNRLLEDKDVEKLVVNMAAAWGKMSGEEDKDFGKNTYQDLLDSVRELLDDVEGSTEDLETIQSIVFVDDSGKMVGRVLKMGDISLEYLRPEDGEKYGLRLNVVSDEMTFNLSGSGLERGGKLFGVYTVEYEGEEAATIKVENFEKDAVKDGKIKGTFTVTPSASLMDSLPVDFPLPDLSLRIDADCGNDKADLKLSVQANDAVYLTLAAKLELGHDGLKQKAPSRAQDVEEWSESVDLESAMQKLTDALEDAGVPSELLESAFSMLGSGMGNDYYYD